MVVAYCYIRTEHGVAQRNCLYPYRSELPRGCDKQEGIGVVGVVGMAGVLSDARQECSSN
jgi:hypothetical protein